jgi:hypothetical protein
MLLCQVLEVHSSVIVILCVTSYKGSIIQALTSLWLRSSQLSRCRRCVREHGQQSLGCPVVTCRSGPMRSPPRFSLHWCTYNLSVAKLALGRWMMLLLSTGHNEACATTTSTTGVHTGVEAGLSCSAYGREGVCTCRNTKPPLSMRYSSSRVSLGASIVNSATCGVLSSNDQQLQVSGAVRQGQFKSCAEQSHG